MKRITTTTETICGEKNSLNCAPWVRDWFQQQAQIHRHCIQYKSKLRAGRRLQCSPVWCTG